MSTSTTRLTPLSILAGLLISFCVTSQTNTQAQPEIQASTAQAIPQPLKDLKLDALEEEKIQRAFKLTFGVTQPENMTSITGGLSDAKLYKFILKDKHYVLRIINIPYNARKTELKIMEIASRAGISPKVRYANAKDGIVIMDYIENKKLTEAELNDPTTYVKLAALLYHVHNAPRFPKSQYTSFSVAFDINEKNGKWDSKLPIILQGKEKIASVEAILKKTEQFKSVHNDVNPNNILYDGDRFWLVDWEASGYSDPYHDIATIANFSIFDEKFEALFLRSYFKRNPTEAERVRYLIAKQVTNCFYGIALTNIALKLGAKPLSDAEVNSLNLKAIYIQMDNNELSLANPDHLLLYSMALLKDSLQNMDSPDFKQLLSFQKKQKARIKYDNR